MTGSLYKPVVSAGFSFLLLASSASAQDYIDVEAEREAARRNAGAPPVVSSQPVDDAAAVGNSNGVGSDAVGDDAVGGNSAYGAPSAYSVPGIQPYSGNTVTVTPVEGTGQPATGSGVNVGSLVIQLQQLQEEVRRLNGIVEEQSQQIQRLNEQSLERYVDLDRRLAAMGITSPDGQAFAGAGGAATGDDANFSFGGADKSTNNGLTFGGAGGNGAQAAETPVQPGEEAAYQGAYDLVKARRFDDAVAAFREFLTEFPFGRYAPNAHYWLGELYLVTEPPDPELARQSFKLLLDQYPNNPKVPDALYKLGRVHFLKGNLDRSSEYLNRVINTYAGHPAAQLAQDFLDQNF